MTSELAKDYFDFLADLGHTKHYGSLETTNMLIALCQFDAGSDVQGYAGCHRVWGVCRAEGFVIPHAQQVTLVVDNNLTLSR